MKEQRAEQAGNYFGCGFPGLEEAGSETRIRNVGPRKASESDSGHQAGNYFGCGPQHMEGANDAEDYSA